MSVRMVDARSENCGSENNSRRLSGRLPPIKGRSGKDLIEQKSNRVAPKGPTTPVKIIENAEEIQKTWEKNKIEEKPLLEPGETYLKPSTVEFDLMSNKKSMTLDSPSRKDTSSPKIDDYLLNPIKCGYLLAFSESEYNAENLRYLIEIDRFRDFMSLDKVTWENSPSWRDIDATVGISAGDTENDRDRTAIHLCNENDWSSPTIHYKGLQEHVLRIWNAYLSEQAPQQICMPSRVLSNTLRRIEMIHKYGKEVFQETTLDPLKTLTKDVFPRFLLSDHHTKLEYRLQQLLPLPDASTVHVMEPNTSIVFQWQRENITVEYLLAQDITAVLHDKYLYSSFLDYLKHIVSAENLLCARTIVIFKELFDIDAPNDQKESIEKQKEDMAWNIYRWFVARNAPYEVGLSHRRRKEMEQSLGSPKKASFYRAEKSSLEALAVHYAAYTKTDAFLALPEIMLKAYDKHKELQSSTSVAANPNSNSSPKSNGLDITTPKRRSLVNPLANLFAGVHTSSHMTNDNNVAYEHTNEQVNTFGLSSKNGQGFFSNKNHKSWLPSVIGHSNSSQVPAQNNAAISESHLGGNHSSKITSPGNMVKGLSGSFFRYLNNDPVVPNLAQDFPTSVRKV